MVNSNMSIVNNNYINLTKIVCNSRYLPFYFNIYLIFFIGIILNTVVQLVLSNKYWSPFYVFRVDPLYEMIYLYVSSFLLISLGYCIGLKLIKRRVVAVNIYLNFGRLKFVSWISLVLVILMFCVTQYYMGTSNVFAIINGSAVAKDIELAIKYSPPLIHGISTVVVYYAVIVIYYNRIARCNRNLLIILLFFVFLLAVSKGKAQGLLYLFVLFLLNMDINRNIFENSKRSFKIIFSIAFILLVFLVTRYLRNQDQELEFGFDLLLRLAGGFYFGSPVANTSYAFEHSLTGYWSSFFVNLIPQKIFDLNNEIWSVLPDATSPSGLIGLTYIAGGIPLVLSYCFCIGILVGVFVKKAINSDLTFISFYPFLVVACLFSSMYNHFLHLNFFWLPLLISYIMKRCLIKQIH